MMSNLHKTVQAPVRQTRALAVAPFEGFDRTVSLALQQEIIDDQLAGFTEGELKVMLSVTRATNGGQRESVPLSVRVLCEGGAPDTLPGRGTGLSPRTVQAACTALETAGYLRITRRIAPDGSGLPSLFTLPLNVHGMRGSGEQVSARFPGYAAGRRVRLPLLVFDKLLAELSGAELKVLLYVLRHTFCVGAADEIMPMARLVENAGLSLRHTRLAVTGLTARGVIQVQHRQDPERGKLPSQFGIKVIGEAAPFTTVPAVPGMQARTARTEEPACEQVRPVWLLPTAEAEATAETRLEVPTKEQNVTAPEPTLQVFPAQVANAKPTAEQPVPTSIQGAPNAAQPARQGGPILPRTIPPSMTRDSNPIWAAAKQILSTRVPYQTFVERVAPTSSVGSGGAELIVVVQDEYHRWWLESKLGRQVREALVEAGYGDVRMRYLNYGGVIPNENERR